MTLKGDRGATGEKGKKGEKGDVGDPGLSGEPVSDFFFLTSVFLNCLILKLVCVFLAI